MAFLAPVIAAVTGAIGAVGATTVGAFALKLGGSLLLSAAASALTPKPKSQTAIDQGRTTSARQPVSPRELVYGHTVKGGTVVFLHAANNPGFGTSGNLQDLHLVIVLASHQVENIGSLYFNGEIATDQFGNAIGRYAGRVEVHKALGGEQQPAFARLIEMLPDYWTAAHRLQGCAAIYVRLVYDASTFPQGLPNITADIYGKNDILDPRSGLRSYSTNAALCLADYMSLPRFGINAQIGADDGINSAALIASANVCDEFVPIPGGGTERRYTCNGVVYLSQTPQEIIEAMLTACGGIAGWQAGQWHIHAAAYRPPVLTLTDDDVAEGGLQMLTRLSMAENCNGVRGVFVSPENDWQQDDFPNYRSAVYVAEDGGEESWRDIVLPFTTSAATAQRLAKIELERTRRQMTLQLSGKMKAWQATVGDTVLFTYARWGQSAKPFEVTSVRLEIAESEGGPRANVTLTLRETSPLVYDALASEFAIYAAAPRTNLPQAFDIAPPGTPTATESLYETRDGGGVKARVDLTWTAAPSAFVADYEVQSRLTGGAWAFQGRTPATTFEILDIAPGLWEFRVKAISHTGVSSEWATTTRIIYALGLPPAAIAGLTAQISNGLVLLSWAQSGDLDVRSGGWIEVRHSTSGAPTIAETRSLGAVPGAATQMIVPQLAGTYFVRAVDVMGNPGPAVSVDVSGQTALDFTSVTTLQADPTFGGTKTGTEVLSGALQLVSTDPVSSWNPVSAVVRVGAAGGYALSGLYEFATGIDFGSVRRVRLRSLITMQTENPLDVISARATPVSEWLRVSAGGNGEVDVVLEVRTTQTDPTGSPVWSPWSRLDSNEIAAWGVQARARLTTISATYSPAVTVLRVIADEVT